MFKNKNISEEDLELGFGTKTYSKNVRFLNKDGSVNIKRIGNKTFDNIDIFHWLITTSWSKLLAMI